MTTPLTAPQTCPREYLDRPHDDLLAAIRAHRERLGHQLTILGHHYQSDAIVGISDYVGDSFQLSRSAAQSRARHIVFCGVRFMAESARVLARPDQTVQHPDLHAGCPMADMADLAQVERAWEVLTHLQAPRRLVPITYMNSNVELKAFCGRHGGSVCTSSNAEKVLNWAYGRGDTVLFFPDEHLGRNTGHTLGMAQDAIALWDPARADSLTLSEEAALGASPLVVWKGHCHVHTYFTVDHVRQARERHPGAHVIVHPECRREVVAAADSAGSTEAIVRRAVHAKPHETIVVGTEMNLVTRLAGMAPQAHIVPLAASVCPNMARINPANLLWTLDHLGEAGLVTLDPAMSAQAHEALERMLRLA